MPGYRRIKVEYHDRVPSAGWHKRQQDGTLIVLMDRKYSPDLPTPRARMSQCVRAVRDSGATVDPVMTCRVVMQHRGHRGMVVLHEIIEDYWMEDRGLTYHNAHTRANQVERAVFGNAAFSSEITETKRILKENRNHG